MSEQLNWTERVNRLTANTVHEALAKLIEEARVAIGISHDALEERVVALDERLGEVQAALSDALAGAQGSIDVTVRSALEEIPAMISRAREQAEVRSGEAVGSLVQEMRVAFAETIERAQQQLNAQSDLLLEEVSSLVSSVDKRLDEITGEIAGLKRALGAGPERQPAPAAEPVEPARFVEPSGAPAEPAFTISLVEDGSEPSSEPRSIWS